GGDDGAEQACDDGERQLADRTTEGQSRKGPDDYTYDQNNQQASRRLFSPPLALKKNGRIRRFGCGKA
ncbi:MAG: hypothetical protein WBQ20_08250, partial [Methyloceanibacter sp.]